MTFAASVWIFATTAGGMPAGPTIAYQDTAWNPVSPAASSIVGTLGSAGERCGLATPSARSFPLSMCGFTAGICAKIMSICPPSRSRTESPTPL